MKLLLRAIILALIVIPLLLYATTYNVRFTEAAVVTTFGNSDPDSVVFDPGLRWQWPWPVQSVTKYDRRGRFVQTRSTSVQTEDKSEVIVEAFAVWRVKDPLVYFQRFSNSGPRSETHLEAGSEAVRSRMLGAVSEISGFSLDELFTVERDSSRIPDLETAIQRRIVGGNDENDQTSLGSYGIELATVGINRIVVPESTTAKIIQRMGESRDRIANEIQAEGDAVARTIRARSQSEAAKIEAFARRRADEIRALGESEAAEFYAQQNAEPELAQFLAKIESMRSTLAERFTLVLSESDYGFSMFSPDALDPAALGGDRFPGGGILDPGRFDGVGRIDGDTPDAESASGARSVTGGGER